MEQEDGTMNANIDGDALLNQFIIKTLDDGTEKGKMTDEVMRVFERRGIGVVDALAIFLEIMAIVKKYEDGGKQ